MNDEQRARLAELRDKHRQDEHEDDEGPLDWTEVAHGVYVLGGCVTSELIAYYSADYDERLHGHLRPRGEVN